MTLTVLLWGLAVVIYISDRKSVTNRWLSVSLAVISLGAFKEYLYYDFWSALPMEIHTSAADDAALAVYNVLTAAAYAFSTPLFFRTSVCFADSAITGERIKRALKRFMFVPGIVMLIVFPPFSYVEYKQSGHVFWYAFTVYNFIYCLATSILMIMTVISEKDPVKRRHKKYIPMLVLPPLWYAFISIYIVHTLWIEPLLKLWKLNVVFVGLGISVYVVTVFRDGMMGIKLHGERYRWDSDMSYISRGARFTSHILKNEITKIEWSMTSLEKRYRESPEELAIIRRSTEHMKLFVEKTRLYSTDVETSEEYCDVLAITEDSLLSVKEYIRGVSVIVDCPDGAVLYCDRTHIIEVLNNLIMNAADAMDKSGEIVISFKENPRKKLDMLSVTDTGAGIDAKEKRMLFEPYYTTKKTNSSFGMGLPYSVNVMRGHGGYIDVESEKGKGSVFTLYFPRIKEKANG
jgi:signal transduction histidine kinase